MECKYFEDATIFDCDFNEIEYKYCMLFDDECKKARRKKDCPYRLHKQLKRKEQENAELKEKLQKFEDMAKKGLEEFKDVGGCWGCGIQLLLNNKFAEARKFRQTLNAIKEIAERYLTDCQGSTCDAMDGILDLIKESEIKYD